MSRRRSLVVAIRGFDTRSHALNTNVGDRKVTATFRKLDVARRNSVCARLDIAIVGLKPRCGALESQARIAE